MLDPSTPLSVPRRSGKATLIDITIAPGTRLTAAFGDGSLPAWVRWSYPQTNLGQANLTTTFFGWSGTSAYQTRLDWRNIDFFKIYVDAYQVDAAVPDLAAPASIRSAPEPPSYEAQPVTSKAIGKGLWRISNGTTVIEFKDHLVLFELGVNARDQARPSLNTPAPWCRAK